MSSIIWTPEELQSSIRPLAGTCWRIVEAQHHVSTMKITPNFHEHDVVEQIIDDTKPVIPSECTHLDFLLKTPFRYGAGHPRTASRFRRIASSRGVLYAAENVRTAVAERTFLQLLFFAESPQTPWHKNPAEYTGFSINYESRASVDLTIAPFDADPSLVHPVDYSTCHKLADTARQHGVQIIRYRSVRDPYHRANIALLTCTIITTPEPQDRQTWRIQVDQNGMRAIREFPRLTLSYDRSTFADDPRIVACRWDR
jgi:hypothetical protein